MIEYISTRTSCVRLKFQDLRNFPSGWRYTNTLNTLRFCGEVNLKFLCLLLSSHSDSFARVLTGPDYIIRLDARCETEWRWHFKLTSCALQISRQGRVKTCMAQYRYYATTHKQKKVDIAQSTTLTLTDFPANI